MNYSQELKEAMLRRMLPPNNESITKISKEEGISEQTLRNWSLPDTVYLNPERELSETKPAESLEAMAS